MIHLFPLYHADMTDPDAPLAQLDDALIRLRRMWSSPAARPVDQDRWPGVELSTVLVADALHRVRGEEPGREVTVASVAGRLGVAQSTASRLVDRAVSAGIACRTASSEDARRTVLALTDRGEQLVSEAEAHRHQILGQTLQQWPAQDVALLAGLLGRFAEAVHTPTP